MLEIISAYMYTMEYREGSAKYTTDCFSLPHQPVTEVDRIGTDHLTSLDTGDIYLTRLWECTVYEPSMPEIGLNGLVPPPSGPIVSTIDPPQPTTTSVTTPVWGKTCPLPGLFSASRLFTGPMSFHDRMAGLLASPENSPVDAGDSSGLAFRPSVVSPPSTIGASVQARSDLTYSLTRYRTATARTLGPQPIILLLAEHRRLCSKDLRIDSAPETVLTRSSFRCRPLLVPHSGSRRFLRKRTTPPVAPPHNPRRPPSRNPAIKILTSTPLSSQTRQPHSVPRRLSLRRMTICQD